MWGFRRHLIRRSVIRHWSFKHNGSSWIAVARSQWVTLADASPRCRGLGLVGDSGEYVPTGVVRGSSVASAGGMSGGVAGSP